MVSFTSGLNIVGSSTHYNIMAQLRDVTTKENIQNFMWSHYLASLNMNKYEYNAK